LTPRADLAAMSRFGQPAPLRGRSPIVALRAVTPSPPVREEI
jgi:hypothetical protein